MSETKDRVDIRNPSNPNQKLVLSAKDYDPAKHELWTEVDEAEALKREMVTDPNRVPMPGPPMQDVLVASSPEALPEQPNAAVIEAPGSRAAELIHRARHDEPINMAGPRQDRAEMETRRAEHVQSTVGISPKQTEEARELRRREYASAQGIYELDEKRVEDKLSEKSDQLEARKAGMAEQRKAQEAGHQESVDKSESDKSSKA